MKIARLQGEYRFLSNFWPAKIEHEGFTFPSVEHAYQAAKMANPIDIPYIQHQQTAGRAKRAARRFPVRDDWDVVKLSVMRDLVRQKFTAHKLLREKLLATGTVILEEGNTWGDTFWGIYRGRGENWVGRILMEVREELRAKGGAE